MRIVIRVAIIELNIAGLHLTRSAREHPGVKRSWCRAWRCTAHRPRPMSEQAA